MKRLFLIVLTAFLLLCTVSCGNGDKSLDRVLKKDKIVVGLNYNLYPLITENGKDGLKGFTADYVNEFANRLGVSAKFVNVKDMDFSAALSENKIDCFINLTNPSRSQKVDYYLIETSVYNKQSVVVNEKSDIKSLADLKGKKVGIVKNSNASKALKEAEVLKSSIGEVEYFSGDEELLKNLSEGSLDAAITGNIDFTYETKKKSGYELKILPDAVSTDCYYLCFDRADTELKDKISEIIELMYSDGTVKTLSEKWFGVDITAK